LEHSAPEHLLQTVEGKVWQWVIPSTDLAAAMQQYLISSTARRSDGIRLRMVSETPPSQNAQAVTPTLEEAYLYFISSANGSMPGEINP
jgi:hypothetical protein